MYFDELSLCFSIFLYISLRPDLLRDPREFDIFYITCMAKELLSQFSKYFRKKLEDTMEETLTLQLEVVLMPLLII